MARVAICSCPLGLPELVLQRVLLCILLSPSPNEEQHCTLHGQCVALCGRSMCTDCKHAANGAKVQIDSKTL